MGCKIADLKHLVETLGISDRVIIHGALSSEELQIVAKHCGFLSPVQPMKAFGMSMLETMTVGMIPLFIRTSPLRNWLVRQGRRVHWLPECWPAANQIIAAQEKKMMPDDQIKAQQFVALYSWDKLIDQTLKTYEDCR